MIQASYKHSPYSRVLVTLPFALRRATGRGVRIALIDSGVNARHSHVGFVAGGTTVSVEENGQVCFGEDYADRIGHGTALAGVLRAKAPQAELFAVKIFGDRLATSILVLDAALRWAIEHQMHVINLSLGTANPAHRERLATTVMDAETAGTIIVASSPPQEEPMLPASFPDVIGVAGDERCGWIDYLYLPESPIPFRAHPCPRPLPGPAQARNFQGHSFASAHVSALLALWCEIYPGKTTTDAKEFFATHFKKA